MNEIKNEGTNRTIEELYAVILRIMITFDLEELFGRGRRMITRSMKSDMELVISMTFSHRQKRIREESHLGYSFFDDTIRTKNEMHYTLSRFKINPL